MQSLILRRLLRSIPSLAFKGNIPMTVDGGIELGSLVTACAIRVLLLVGVLPRCRQLLDVFITSLFLLYLLLLIAFLWPHDLHLYVRLLFIL